MSLPELKEKAITCLSTLIDHGEKLASVDSHPGQTKDFIEWKNCVDTYIQSVYGVKSPIWGRVAEIMIFPRWFDNSIHGTGPEPDGSGRPVGMALTSAHDSDRKTAFRIYKQGLEGLVALLKSVKDDIEINGLPSKSDSEKSSVSSLTIAPSFIQSQSQSQQQTVTVKQEIQNLITMVEGQRGEDEANEAKELLQNLEESPKKWANVEKVIIFFLKLGRDSFVSLLPLLVQILLKQP